MSFLKELTAYSFNIFLEVPIQTSLYRKVSFASVIITIVTIDNVFLGGRPFFAHLLIGPSRLN